MVEGLLVASERLEPQLRESGRALLTRLDEANAAIVAAFWLFDEEVESWRLYLATPLVETKGPLKVYAMIQEILPSLSEQDEAILDLANISVVNPHLRIIEDLRQQYGKIEHEDSRRIRRTSAPYIYRLI